MMQRVVILTDEPMVERGLRALIEKDPEFEFVYFCHTEEEIIRAATEHQPNLIVYGFAPDPGFRLIRELRRIAPQAAVVLWSRGIPPELACEAIELGVLGLVSTIAAPETLKECLRIAARGELWMEESLAAILLNARPVRLSKRQGELLELIARGLKNKEIGAVLGISEATVKAYLSALLTKLGVRDRFGLVLLGLTNAVPRYFTSTRTDRVHPGGGRTPQPANAISGVQLLSRTLLTQIAASRTASRKRGSRNVA